MWTTNIARVGDSEMELTVIEGTKPEEDQWLLGHKVFFYVYYFYFGILHWMRKVEQKKVSDFDFLMMFCFFFGLCRYYHLQLLDLFLLRPTTGKTILVSVSRMSREKWKTTTLDFSWHGMFIISISVPIPFFCLKEVDILR